MVNDDESRWKHTNPHVPRYSGKIPDLEGFDATFFGVHHLQANNMDPQNRLLIEESFKCVMDAGVNPNSLRDANTGVFIGACVSESESFLYYNQNVPSGFGITGCSKAMFANRVSYTLGLTGPSMLCDTACSSSMYALNLAYHAFKNGEIDSAIVGGSNLCLHPNCTLQFGRLGVLSLNGYCCPFDADANGYTRSEAVGCIFLQRRSAAKRIYATLLYSDTNCDGYKSEGITYPSGDMQEKLLKSVYDKTKFDLNELGYIEAHSTGTIAGDPEECKAIDNAICKKRDKSLLVGSVKSNCGHTEPVSGICSIVKVIFAMQNNAIPPNINFKRPKQQIEALVTGRLKVVTDPTPLPKPFVAINSFGFGGANAHALLRQFEKDKPSKNESNSLDSLPRLVNWSARTEDNVNHFFDDLDKHPLDPEYLALIQSTQAGGIQGMVFRGYSILKPNEDIEKNPITLSKKTQHYGGVKRPLVWVFSGMGSQWVGMGKALMQVPLFRQSLMKCHNTLKPSGLDLIQIVTSDDPHMFDNILHSFVGIAAIQIGLVDILRALEITPDFIIGHSVGELGCAYADNCMTAEQMILAAYYRGKVSVDAKKIKGSMAAVGLSFKDIKPMLPEAIEVACHNSSDSCTISGPCDDVAAFVKSLKEKNIFAREVPCSNIAYHSRYIAQLGPELLKYLRHILPKPQLRSNKWISTSVPKTQWLTPESKYSSAEYHTNNLLNSVLFEEASTFLPKNALTIEIAPHALLQSILKNALPGGIHIGLTRRNAEDNTLLFLNALGNLYLNGLELSIEKLYPPVEWPVSRGTACYSHLVEFDHSGSCFVYKYKDNLSEKGIENFVVKLQDEDQYLAGHEIDGRILAPATFYLECVWRTFASSVGVVRFENQAVEFENVNFIRATPLSRSPPTELVVTIHRGSGKFEITEAHSLIVTGTVREAVGATQPPQLSADPVDKKCFDLSKKDFYKELKLRGYHYKGDFKGVEMVKSDGSMGKVKWTQNWVTFMDCMLQISMIAKDTRNLMLPTRFRLLRIFPEYHLSVVQPDESIEVHLSDLHNRIVCGGIELIDLAATSVQRRRVTTEPVLEKYQFIPQLPAPKMELTDVTRCCIQLVLENFGKPKLQIIDFTADRHDKTFLMGLMQAVEDLPSITCNFMWHHKSKEITEDSIPGVTHIYTGDEGFENTVGNILITTRAELNTHSKHLEPNGILIVREQSPIKMDNITEAADVSAIAAFPCGNETFILLKKSKIEETPQETVYLKITANDNNFEWIQKLKEIQNASSDIVLVSENEPVNGILGLVNCLRREPDWKNVRCLLIDDVGAPAFDGKLPLYGKQLRLGLGINVYRKGNWGTYRHLKLSEDFPATTRSDYVYSSMLQIGNLSSIRWCEGPHFDKMDVNVVYSSLNFRDVMLASGRLPIEVLKLKRIDQLSILGFEFSGINAKTKRPMMGMTAMGAISSNIPTQSPLFWDIPSNWSLREAATVPVVYTTVYYAFFTCVDIRNGKSILIHAGSGGIGIAAIRVAFAYGLDVFTTVSTQEKKSFLMNMFPQLKESHIGNSRDTSFETMILEQTNGRGVDYVLNSLAEDKLIASVRCLAKRGHFLEIGKFDMASNNSLGLGVFLNELSFHAVIADSLLDDDPSTLKYLKDHMEKDMASGIIQPLPSTVYTANEVEKACRFLMSGKHIGKVLIQIREDIDSAVTLPISVQPRIFFDRELAYVVPGGLGGFGLELVDWMVLRGARKIVLSSSRGLTDGYQKLRISLWESYGCLIAVNTSDISTLSGCKELLTAAAKIGAIGGIFNLAVVLKDAIFTNQTAEQFQQSFKPKANATKYLDQLSRQLCPKLQHFVIFSSVSCGRGNAGQSNYGMANSIMERIIEDRVSHGLPGKAIQWGAVGEVGLVAEMAEGKIDLDIGGTLQQRISSCLEVLDTLLACNDPVVSSMVIAEKLSSLAGQSAIDFVLRAMSIRDIKSIALNSTLSEIGMDSLMGIEIKQTLERDYDIILSPTDLRNLTLSKLIELSDNRAENVSQKTAATDVNYGEMLRLFYGDMESSCICTANFHHVNEVTEGDPIIFIPGIDGCSSEVWRSLGMQLKQPAYVLQFQIKTPIKTMTDIIEYAYKEITQFLSERNSKKFQIVAYSFGAMAIHPTIALLENNGYSGRAIFIDGSTAWVESLMEAVQAVYNSVDLEKRTLAAVVSAVAPDFPLKNIEKDLRDKFHREDFLLYVREIMSRYEFQNAEINYVISVLDILIQKVHVLEDPQSYKAATVIECPLMLIKPSILTIGNLDDTYGLAPFTTCVIDTNTLEGDHQTILQNTELALIINHYFN